MRYPLNATGTSCLLILDSSVQQHLPKSLNKQLCAPMKTLVEMTMTMMTTCINSMKKLKNESYILSVLSTIQWQ